MIRWMAIASLLGAALSGACATSGTAPRTFDGTNGSIQWQVVDLGRVAATDDSGLRWSYTVVLTNAGKSAIRFEHFERGSRAASLAYGPLGKYPFERTLAPGGETRASFVDTWQTAGGAQVPFGGAATFETLTVERRFIGKDEQGAPVVVPVIVHLNQSVGKLSPRLAGAPRPHEESRARDAAELAGIWRGHYRDNGVYPVPLRLEVSRDGSFEAFENDPVTRRLRGRLRVQDGRVMLSMGADSGTLTLHQGAGRRLLIGAFEGPRKDAGASYTFTSELWVEADLSTTWTPPNSVALPPAVRVALDTYKLDAKFTHFKAFATDRVSGAWGRAWGRQSAATATEQALYSCGQAGGECEVYAVGDTILDAVSPDQRAVILLGGANLTYAGVLTTEHGGKIEASPATVYVRRDVTEITGSWNSGPGVVGMITGPVSDTSQARVRMTQSLPCRVEFTGALSIGERGKRLDASYTGVGCDGAPLKATFTGTRK